MALRISKEYARNCKGAYNVDALSKDVVQAVQNAHKIYKKRKAEKDKEKRKNYIHEQELMNKEKEQKEMLEKVENKNKNLDQQEKSLKNDEKNAVFEFQLAQRMLNEAAKSMQSAIIKEDMMGIKIAHEMINSAKRSLENALIEMNRKS
ncbi:DNA ligase 1-like [Hydra vulgaris]|uniref:DNA ligase 1-like n=1 Tax=Hydra vulgaris TaxID=6087 RepID=UPI001F5FCF48|nr:DNA ligase 1-like [Hydra vulgaris]